MKNYFRDAAIIMFLAAALIFIILVAGCSGTGLDRRTKVVPNSVSFGYAQEKYPGDSESWRGFTASATWVFE